MFHTQPRTAIAAYHGDDGVLVLSEFTGSAVELPEAILTNPYSDQNMDDCIDQALAMSAKEQCRRMQALYRTITRYDVQQWANHMFREANAISIVEGNEPKRELALA